MIKCPSELHTAPVADTGSHLTNEVGRGAVGPLSTFEDRQTEANQRFPSYALKRVSKDTTFGCVLHAAELWCVLHARCHFPLPFLSHALLGILVKGLLGREWRRSSVVFVSSTQAVLQQQFSL